MDRVVLEKGIAGVLLGLLAFAPVFLCSGSIVAGLFAFCFIAALTAVFYGSTGRA